MYLHRPVTCSAMYALPANSTIPQSSNPPFSSFPNPPILCPLPFVAGISLDPNRPGEQEQSAIEAMEAKEAKDAKDAKEEVDVRELDLALVSVAMDGAADGTEGGAVARREDGARI